MRTFLRVVAVLVVSGGLLMTGFGLLGAVLNAIGNADPISTWGPGILYRLAVSLLSAVSGAAMWVFLDIADAVAPRKPGELRELLFPNPHRGSSEKQRAA